MAEKPELPLWLVQEYSGRSSGGFQEQASLDGRPLPDAILHRQAGP